jgi:branched-chain amino acid transport system ATP-binding protein
MLLSVDNLTVKYGKAVVATDVSLEVADGAIVALLGANGAGKSSLLRVISGLKRAAAGRVLFEGADICSLAPHEIVGRGLVQVPEGRRLFPFLTVLENLKLGASRQKDKKKIAADQEKVFTYFPKLKQRARQKAGTMSGGEQQMLAIARSLMSDPKLLILDEPSLGLAPLVISELGRIGRAINQTGVSILLVEQNVTLAFELAEYGYVLDVGRVIMSGPMEDLKADESITRAYLG